MLGLEFARAYIDNILVLARRSDWKDHTTKLALVFDFRKNSKCRFKS
jgi:hypothetical protein